MSGPGFALRTAVARAGEALRFACEGAGSLLYPPRCEICAAQIGWEEYLCETCGGKARRIEPPFCQTCSAPFDGDITTEFSCANCHDRHFHFTHAVSCFRSRGVVRELIHRFKYDGEFHLRHPLAGWLAETMGDERIARQRVDLLVPVPLHARRMREREFNQAEVLARLLTARTGVVTENCLERVRYTTTQTRFDRAERMENLRNAFGMRKTANVRGRHLVLVDDVLTTGSTLDECARVLLRAGAASVRAITVARG